MKDDTTVKPLRIATLPAKIASGNGKTIGTAVLQYPMPCGIGGFSTGC